MSSQQQSTNSNNSQAPNSNSGQPPNSNNDQPPYSNNYQLPNTNPYPEISNYQYNDYEPDPSLPVFNNSNIYDQSSYLNSGGFFYPTIQEYPIQEYYNDADDDIPSDIEAELDATEEMMEKKQLNDNDVDESIFSDDVQNAFANYENECSQYWKRNEPNWNTFPDDEQEEIFDQMRECMLYMSQEYSTAEMPENLIERTQESKLNPDAVEFRPSWSSSSTATDKEPITVTSWIPCEAKKQEKGQDDS